MAHRGGNADGFGILQNPEGVVPDGGDPVVDHNAVYGLVVAGKITFLICRKIRDHADTGNGKFSVVIQLPHHLAVFILSADDQGRLRLFAVGTLPVLVLMAVGRDDLSGVFKNDSAVGAFQPIFIAVGGAGGIHFGYSLGVGVRTPVRHRRRRLGDRSIR